MSIQNLAGQTLGQYELRELLGAGGMGAVYKGYQPSLKRYVAVKVLAAQFSQQAGAIERFNREAETSAALEHPHIIHIYDYGTQQGVNYLVMQLLTGGTLSERIEQQEGRLPSLGEIAELLKQVASALDHAHSKGVIHRDIKPSNVMFDNHGTAYLVDFGIARLAEATRGLTASGMVIGTWGYMAPEQWRAETPTPATDQYALGVMTYALVTGHMPFDAPTPAGMMHKHMNEMPAPPRVHRPGVPEALTDVIERALAKKSGDRFATCTAFAQAFDKAIRGSTGEITGYFTSPVQRRSALGIGPGTFARPATSTQPFYTSRAAWAMMALIVVMALVIVTLLLNEGGQAGSKPTGTAAGAAVSDTPTTDPAVMIAASDTPRPTDTPPPSTTHTPQSTATPLPKATRTSTALPPTDTPPPTATDTPLPTAVSVVEIQSSDTPESTITLTATQTPSATRSPEPTTTYTPTLPPPSATPRPTDTPDLNATANALLSLHLTQTAESWTDTPAPTDTLTPTLTITPDLLATAEAMANAGMTATADAWTDTPAPSPTSTATATRASTSTATPTKQPTRTPRPTPMPLSIPEMPSALLVYEEDFEDGDATGWSHDQQYNVLDDGTGNRIWRVLDSGYAFLTLSHQWPDYVLEISYAVLNWGSRGGSWEIDLRGIRNSSHWYSIDIDQDGTVLTRRAGQSTLSNLAGGTVYHSGIGWHSIRVKVQGSYILWQQDNGIVYVARIDEDSATGIGLFTWGTSEIWFDDIRVWKIEDEKVPLADTPVSEPTPDAAAREAMFFPAGSSNGDWTPVVQSFDGVTMVYVPAGCFMMGSEGDDEDEQPVHEVCLDAFWIDQTEVTNGQYGSPGRSSGIDRPRDSVSWNDVQAFCESRGARLPTEAEWEYAARGPEGWVYPWGNEFAADNVVYGGNSGRQTTEVGSRPYGGSWVGALDMSGNVWEWVADWYGTYGPGPQVNPAGPGSGENRVLRGGSWVSVNSASLRAANRYGSDPTYHNDDVGFRCARS